MNISSIKYPLYFFILITILYGCKGSEEIATTEKEAEEIAPIEERLSEQKIIKVDKLYYDATKAKILEQYDKALDLYKEVLKIDPYNHAARYEVAQLYKRKGIKELAMKNAEEAVRLKPDNKSYNSLYADVLADDNQYEQAADVYNRLKKQHPQEVDYYFEEAYLLSKAGKRQAAIDVYNELEEMVGVSERLVKQKQRLYLKMGKIEKAAAEINKLIESNPQNARYYRQLAEMYEANDMDEKAVQTYERLLEVDPDNAYANLALAKLMRDKGDSGKYFDNLKKAFRNPNLEIDAKISILYPYIDSMRRSNQQKEEAFTLAEILIETHPEEAKAHAIYGDLLNQDDQQDAALEQYKEAIQLDESQFSVWQQLFFITSEQERFDELLKHTEEALTLFPNQPLVYYFNGVANSQLDNYQEAVDILKQGIRIVSGNESLKAQMYANLGDAYHNLEEHAKSDSAYSKSLSYEPENAYVLNNYSYYLSLRKEDLDKAERMSNKANKIDPGNATFQDTYAWILFQQGEYEKAKKWIEKAIENNGSDDAVILEHYGDILFKLGQKQEAVNYWQKAKNQGLESDTIDKKIANKKLYE